MFDQIRQFLKLHRLWLGLGAVAIPLALLLGLQLKWLSSLERTSAIAEKAWLSTYIEAVSSEIEFFYRAQAERTLNIPDELFGRSEGKLAAHLRKKTVEGVRAIFVTRFDAVAGPWDGLLVFDPVRSDWVEESDDEAPVEDAAPVDESDDDAPVDAAAPVEESDDDAPVDENDDEAAAVDSADADDSDDEEKES